MSDVTIIGAGVAGLWAAYALTQRGITPHLIDRNGAPGAHGCSWWAGGMLAPFCEGATSEPAVIRHGQQAAADWAEVTEVTQNGSLVVTLDRDRAELDRFARRTTGHSRISGDALAALEPDLATPGREALFFASESHLTPRRALADLVNVLTQRGITIELSEAAPDDIPGTVLDCRGLAANTPGLRGVRGEMVMLRTHEVQLSRPVRLLHPRHPLYIVPRGDGVFMLGATQIESARRGPVTARALLELLSAAYALHPAFAEAEVIETGADLRPAFADHVPRVIRQGRVLHLNGLFRHGYLMAPALARQAADFLEHGTKGDLFHDAD
ncbi:MAG: FAD-dependent oxidoreductase [Rhodobacterales bacterium]|nr:FAD-dependent oxidoreductase [Rhodobacterales bacterium]